MRGNDREGTPLYGIKCNAWTSSVMCDYIEYVNNLWLYGATNCLSKGIVLLLALLRVLTSH
jgi:hypothetical protein